MRAGQLREPVTFQRQSQSDEPDETGNVKTGWSDILTVMADIRETPGKERLQAGRLEASRTATIRVRKSPQTSGIVEADRIVARGAKWNIRSIVQVDRQGRILEFLAETGVAT